MIRQRAFIILSRRYATKPNTIRKADVRPIQLITCKQTKFNMQQTEVPAISNAKFGTIPLASSGWHHYKAKSDHFTIHPTALSPDTDAPSADARQFNRLALDEQLVTNLMTNLGINTASEIQSKAIPSVLAMNHTLIAAETGCGKTIAYLVPIIQQILHRKRHENAGSRRMNTPLALVLTPSRELAVQIGSVAEKLCSLLGVSVHVLLGGRTKSLMMNPSFEDVDLLIGSMGATSKLVTTSIYRMDEVRHVVLDEADTMLDDSFNEKLIYFLRRFPVSFALKCAELCVYVTFAPFQFYKNQAQDISEQIVGAQLLLVAATMPTNSEELLQSIIDPKTLHRIVSPNLHRILPHVPQKFMRMNKAGRPMELLALVKADVVKKRPVIVFGNKSATSDYVSMFLNDHGVSCVNLNGDMLQQIRVGQFEKFQTGEVNVLSTTDIASRGLDTTRVRRMVYLCSSGEC